MCDCLTVGDNKFHKLNKAVTLTSPEKVHLHLFKVRNILQDDALKLL